MPEQIRPSLFGIRHSNKDFSRKESWGKNQFNNCFPAALAAYMHHKELRPIYLVLSDDLSVRQSTISITELFGISPESERLYFAFESDFSPYRRFVLENLPRVDLVTQDLSNASSCLRGIEIKLTALPDNTTWDLPESQQSCEIVTRPDTIVYVALHIAESFETERDILREFLSRVVISDWTNINAVLANVPKMIEAIDSTLRFKLASQKPLVMQPIWKTEGKTLRLNKNCLDMFVWSAFAFSRLFVDVTKENLNARSINRPMRSVIWLFRMLLDFALGGQIAHKRIIDELSYNTRNDRAFAVSGSVTYPYLKSDILLMPRIHREEIKQIILGGGEKFLSPERRFDAVLLNTTEIFNESA